MVYPLDQLVELNNHAVAKSTADGHPGFFSKMGLRKKNHRKLVQWGYSIRGTTLPILPRSDHPFGHAIG